MKRCSPRAEDFTVGWISALSVELTAATAMLDEEYEGSDDTTQYMLGRIGKHNVVIICLPAGHIGTSSAAVVATEMRSKFPALQIGLMVGIGGGVPSNKADIRLGDVVISQPQGGYGGVVQYDFGKTGPGGVHTPTGFLNAPPTVLLTAATKLRSSRSAGRSNITAYLSSLAPFPEYNRCNAGPDTLFRSSYSHVGGLTCDWCCKDMVVIRSPRASEEMVIHYGIIASGNQIMRDGPTRDKLSAELGGVLCFEMEAAGLMNSFPCLVIRGICDYADSHKNKKWQPFAAAAAAACAKEILSFVPTASRSNDPGIEVTQHIARNHIEISRSGGPVDVEYGKVVGTHNQVVGATPNEAPLCARSALRADQRHCYLDSLKFDQINARYVTIKTAHAKTCRWLLSKAEYRDWLNVNKPSEHHGFLWIKGKPATGKSTIMKFAYTYAKKNLTGTIISFFFNARGEDLEKSALGMYRSLLFQLLKSLPDLQDVFDFLTPTAPISGDFYRWDIETVKSLFGFAIEKLGQRCLTCFIDALDECGEDQVREMVTFFGQLGQLAASSQFQFRVCFSSRHYPYITIRKGTQLFLEGQEGHQQDIANYLHSELKAGHGELVTQIEAEILERASGIFLWVVLVVQMLNKEYDHGRIHALRKRLDEIPNGLNELFRDILTRDGQNMEELILCLQCILYAKRPLKCEELYFAILAGVEPEALTAWSSEEITKQDMERFILSSSKGLAEVPKSKNQTVQFIHESVRDFLKENGLRELRSDLGSNFPGLGHERLKQCCQNYMMIDTSKHLPLATLPPSASSEDATNLRRLASGKFPFLEYAVHSILHHADIADSYGVSQDTFMENFPLGDWITLDNLFERYQIRRHTSDASLLYILAEKNLPSLTRSELKRVQHIDIRGERYGFPLLAALALTNENTVRALLTPDTGGYSDSDTPDNRPSYSTEGDYQEAIRYLLKAGRDISSQKDQTVLSWAAERGNIALVKILLETGRVDVNSKARHGQTPLWFAARNGHKAVVKQLLSTGRVDADSKAIYGQTPLSFAAMKGQETVVKLLLATGCVDVDCKINNIYGQTPLSLAAQNGRNGVVKQLLATGQVDVGFKDSSGRTPLSLAAGNGHEAVVKQLLATGRVEVDSKDSSGSTSLSLAAMNGHEAVVEQLLATGRVEADSKDSSGQTPLSGAAHNGHKAVVKQLLAPGQVDVGFKDSYGWTPLSWAAQNGCKAVVKQLLATDQVDVGFKDSSGRTPLSWAAQKGRKAVVKQLLATGQADVDSKDSSGRTPLSWAAQKGRKAVVKQLLATGQVDVDSKDSSGRTPLSLAAGNGHDAVVKLLQSHDNQS
jgi:ankyrin repeat protein/nucleoside phosphorylase